MGAAVPIRTDISAGKLRRLARQETDGRVACRLFGVANALDGMSRERAARQAGMDRQTLRDSLARQLLTPSRFSGLIAEFARDHPAAERLEVWFLDEARVGQTGRVGRRWYQKGNAPARGARPAPPGVYLFGAVCPERDAGVALVLPAVSAAAMQAMLDELSQAVTPDAHAVVLMDRAGRHIAKALAMCQPHAAVPAALLARAQRHRAGLAASSRALPLAPPVANPRRHPRRLLRRLECPPRRSRPHPLPPRPRLGNGQSLMGLVMTALRPWFGRPPWLDGRPAWL